MGYVMQRAPVKPERAILEANMGGDKKPSHEYFQSGHGKTVLAEAFLSDEQIRRVLRTTAEDLEALSWAGTHGSVASGMQSVAFTPASAIAAVFAATGQDLGMVGTSSMAHGTAPPRRGRPAGVDPLRRARGRHRRRRHDAARRRATGSRRSAARARGKVYRFAQIVAAAALCLEISASAAMATAGSENFFQAHHERGGLCGDRARLPLRGARPEEFEEAYGPEGDWAQFFRQGAATSAPSSCATSRSPSRYLVIDRWESADAYNAFLAEHQRRVHAPQRRDALPLPAGAALRHVRERLAE